MGKQKKRASKLITQRTNIPALVGDDVLVKTEHTKGIVQLSSISLPLKHVVENEAGENNDNDSEAASIGLKWQGYSELAEDHGFSGIYQVLGSEFGGQVSDEDLDKMSDEIAREIGETSWSRVENFLLTLDKESGHRDVFILAAWAEIFSEPFEELWLAAMAQHAHIVIENNFAFGYLTALLDQKRNNEALFLRGKKSLEDSQLGGKIKPRTLDPITAKILAEMVRLTSKGHSISNAASLTFKKGFGSSKDANRKLWERHKK